MRNRRTKQKSERRVKDTISFPKDVENHKFAPSPLPDLPAAKADQIREESHVRDSKFQLLLTVLPVLSAALYLVGTIYQESYLKAFGVDNSMFPLQLDRVWLYGFTSLLSFGLGPMLSGVSVAVLVFAVVMISAVLSSLPKVQRIRAATIQRIRSWLGSMQGKPSPTLVSFLDRAGVLYFYFAGAIFIVIALVFALVFSSNAGVTAAEGDKAKWSDGMRPTAVVGIQGEQTITSFQVTCGTTHCAFWTGNETRLLRHEQVASLLAYPAKKISGKSSK